MTSSDLQDLRSKLLNTWPIIGAGIRRKAVRNLASDGGPETVPLLIEALSNPDGEVAATALNALENLKNPAAVDALCAAAIAAPSGPVLGICARTGNLPRDPDQACLLLFLTKPLDPYFRRDPDFQALRRAYDRASAEVKASVLAVVGGTDPRTRQFLGRGRKLEEWSPAEAQLAADLAFRESDWDGVLSMLRGPSTAKDPAESGLSGAANQSKLPGLFAAAIDAPEGSAARLCAAAGLAPADPDTRCLFLFVTKQLDQYAREDPGFEKLGRAYAAAQPQVRARVVEVVRAGDPRCHPFFGKGRTLSDCSPQELAVFAESAIRHEDWPLLVAALKEPAATAVASAALRATQDRKAAELLCHEALLDPAGPAARICLESGKRPRDHRQACLFLFVTRQLDAYFQEDFEFQELRPAYDQAIPEVKAHVLAVVGETDPRGRLFLGRGRKLEEWTPAEAQLAVDLAFRESDWDGVLSMLRGPSTAKDPAESGLSGAANQSKLPGLFAAAITAPEGSAAQVCAAAGLAPADPDTRCLFLFITKQLDQYALEDPGFEKLARAYAAAQPQVRARVVEVVRAGDPRCHPFFGKGRTLSDCSPQELAVFAESAIRHEDWPLLVAALKEPAATAVASAALRATQDRKAAELLCHEALLDPAGPAARICVETGKRPRDHRQACLFLFVTRQLDAYIQEDFEFQELRPAYDQAVPGVKAHVHAVVREGDPRCLGLFGRRKRWEECSEEEVRLALDSMLRHRDWPKLFAAFQNLPLKYGFPLLAEFRKSGWLPDNPAAVALLKGAISESGGQSQVQPKPVDATSAVFDRWLAEGRTAEWSKHDESQLLERLASAIPPDGVRIVAALAAKPQLRPETAQAVQSSVHWLVRLAGYSTGICRVPISRDTPSDSNYWINQLVLASPVLELWPAHAPPDVLEELQSAPREAFSGKLGTARRVLRLLLANNTTGGEFTEKVADDDGGAEWTPARPVSKTADKTTQRKG